VQDRDLIVGVLAAQAGFVTPSQVLTAAAAVLIDGSDSLLARLEKSGALSNERRKMLEVLAEQALAARKGDVHAVAESLGGAALLKTLVSQINGEVPADSPHASGAEVPLELPGHYTRLGELGRGSQSIVLAARDEIVGREVALKELVVSTQRSEDDSSRAARARFLREVRLVAGLDHPGIVNILELARKEDGTLFCAQKLIRGETLQARLAKCPSLEDRLVLVRHVLDACQAMGFAHSRKVIHRDLKPSNIMVGEYGETVVVDWGLAKHRDEAEEVVPLVESTPEPGLTVAGVALGTPAYMSPEQARGDLAAIDTRSDVFSLGAILYQVLTGRPPFEGLTPDHILENVRAGRFAPIRTLAPNAPPELVAIAERALRPEPSKRYRDAEELAKELSAYLAGGRVRAYQYGAWELLRKFAASHRALTAGVAVALGALLISAAAVAVRLQIARRELARAFIERARSAEWQSDWAMAAGYFAAARTQRDSAEARWGVALATNRAAERILSLTGPPGSFTDVGVLADGRVVVLLATPNRVEVRELDGGKVLWNRDVEVIADHPEADLGSTGVDDRFGPAAFALGQVRINQPNGWAYFDAATGAGPVVWDRDSMGAPCEGRISRRIGVLNGKLIARGEGQPDVTLATDVTPYRPRCAVSEDGRQLAYRDTGDRVHLLSLPDGRRLAERPGKGVRDLLFSRHGLILVRQGWLDSMGVPGGDFAIALGEGAFTLDYPQAEGGSGLSPDGEMVIVSRLGSSGADIVDLRTRSIRAVLHYASGWPRFAFSSDGQRIFAVGFGRTVPRWGLRAGRPNSQLAAWRLPRDRTPSGHPGSWLTWTAAFFPTCCQLVIADQPSGAVHIHGPQGEFLDRESIPNQSTYRSLAGDGALLYRTPPDRVTLRDAEQHRDVWTRRCPGCSWSFSVSHDRTRAAYSSLEGFEVWDVKADRVLFRDTSTKGSPVPCGLSPDGERTVWSPGSTAHVRDLSTGSQRELRLDGVPTRLVFSPDSTRLAVLTSGSLSVWDPSSGRALWRVANAEAAFYWDLRWSADHRSLLLDHYLSGTLLVDAATGELLTRFPGEPGINSTVRLDLRAELLVSNTNWDLVPLPEPASDSPADGLAKTLRTMGLALDGAEIVAAP
jgi:tRNA A-37 threonylcarbamoyl transferase component Bud32